MRFLSLILTVALGLAVVPGAAQQGGHPAAPGDTVRYVTISSGRVSGQALRWREADGAWGWFLEHNDRGRGPSIRTRTRLDAAGLPVWLEAEGVNYYKTPFRERYELRGGRAAWQNTADRGEVPATGPVWYDPVNAALDPGVLVRALLAAPGRSLPVLPEGRVRLDSVASLTVRAGDAAREVVQYAVSGLGFQPAYVWLDRGGDFFASGGSWLAIVRAGWQDALPALFQAQDRAEARWMEELGRTLAYRPAGPVVIRDAVLFDPATLVNRPETTVIVMGDTIVAVGPDWDVAVPPGAQVIDAGGKSLLPGLWDMHVHLNVVDGPMHLAAGVTSVRDLGNDSTSTPQVAAAWNAGTLAGPRVPVIAGVIDGKGPYAAPAGHHAETAEEARAGLDYYASVGRPQIKLYSSLDPALVPDIIAQAHRRGMRVSGHIPNGMRAEEAVRLGYDEIQHINMLVLNFLSDMLDTRTPERFSGPAEGAALLDLEGPQVRAFVRLLRDRGTVVDPTVNVFERLFTARPGTVDPVLAAVEHRLPPSVQRGLRGGGLPVPDGMDERYRQSFDAVLRLVALLHREGVPLVAGTDAMPGFALHHELELYERAGIPTREVLRMATLGAARVAGREHDLGSIRPGKLADLILVDGNPAERITDLRNVELVMKGGVLYRPEELWAAVGVAGR
ncbi:MAG TPA: amidohydrolase family protein [Longimicrobium sp.]|nr:amidohydrolase family protein [Longimicrobium sp.]